MRFIGFIVFCAGFVAATTSFLGVEGLVLFQNQIQIGSVVALVGLVMLLLGRKPASKTVGPTEDPLAPLRGDMNAMRQDFARFDATLSSLNARSERVFEALRSLTPETLLQAWEPLLVTDLRGLSPEALVTLRTLIPLLKELQAVPALTGPLVDAAFSAKLATVVNNLKAMEGVDIPTVDIERAAGLVALVSQVEDRAETAVRKLTLEERVQLLLEAIEKTADDYGDDYDDDFDRFMELLASVFSELADDKVWGPAELRKHRRLETENTILEALNNHSRFDDWEDDNDAFKTIWRWLTEAHEPGEDFQPE